MNPKVIDTSDAPGAIGPYSQGWIYNGLVFVSGQLPVAPETGAMPDSIVEQAEQSCKNVAAILSAAGSDATRVLKTTICLTGILWHSIMSMQNTSRKSLHAAVLQSRNCQRALSVRLKPLL